MNEILEKLLDDYEDETSDEITEEEYLVKKVGESTFILEPKKKSKDSTPSRTVIRTVPVDLLCA